ncbi:MAG: efflux RND transporter periplasmic adaptor subunit [Prolixibacteraceae bacterium]|nr:efflux RND transporter periplasmic adaptor subunit [Prolixibacteraceae bacterium]
MKTKFLIFITIITLVSCGQKKTKKIQKASIPVEVINPTVYTNSDVVTNGVIESNETARIGTRLMGYIQKINVTQGMHVKKGDLLISISDNELKAQLTQAKAMLTKAKAAYDVAKKDEGRYKRLLERESCSEKEYEQIHLNFISMKASMQAAEQSVNEVNVYRTYTQITAPFSGIVSAVSVKEGSLASPGTTLITIEKTGVMVAQTQIDEDRIQYINPGMIVKVSSDDNSLNFNASVSERSLSSIATGGQYMITIAIPKTIQDKLTSGMHVKIFFTLPNGLSQSHKVILIPRKSIYTQGALQGVFIASDNNYAVLRWLRLGRIKDDNVEVLSGLDATDKIIVSTGERIKNGTPITIK